MLIDAMVQMDEDTYTVGEGDGSVEVCVEIGSVPSGGLESELVVTLTISSGTKTGEYVYMECETKRIVLLNSAHTLTYVMLPFHR